MISLGLVGFPLAHSLSPIIHDAALRYCGLKGNYSLFPVSLDDVQGLEGLLASVRGGSILGLNVTIPYKQKVIPLLDGLTQVAQAVGAVNTIYMQNGKLIGDNTDAPGFLADMHRYLGTDSEERAEGKKSLVLGAGGAACAVVYALVNAGWQVALAARRPEQTRVLVAKFQNQGSNITRIDYDTDAFLAAVSGSSLVVNTTPVGMYPAVNASPWPGGSPMPRRAVVYDLVYNPRETKFVQDARFEGLRAIGGLGMLVEQAAMAFNIWTGYDVPHKILFAALEEK
jgi:shikimate dehydrogenase